MDNIKLFPCYSHKLLKFLINKNIRYQLVALNPKSKKTMWIFVESNELNNALIEWKKTNPN